VLGLGLGLVRRVASWLHRRDVTVWYDVRYRLPISGIEAGLGLEPRRADFTAWWLRESGVAPERAFRRPHRISWENLARVHTAELLESLSRSDVLASVFGADPSDVPVDEVLTTVRLACGGTLAGARETLKTRVPALNLLGGFHHAAPATAAGNCPVNDIAVAVATLRAEGFDGQIAILDLDAHPPDGLAACLGKRPDVWIGSLSGSDWGPLEDVDETVLPARCGDAAYLDALAALLGRMPRPRLAFVIAGGDVLAGDRFGELGLTLDGARSRDLLVAAELEYVPSVWVPGGGYSRGAWRVLAGAGMAVGSGSREPIPAAYDPIAARFERVSAELSPSALTEDDGELSTEEIEEELGMRPRRQRVLLGFYTAAGVEQAFYRFGIFDHLERLGYRQLRAAFDAPGEGERLRILGQLGGEEHLLAEAVLERRRVAGVEALYVHWLSLRNPRAQFSDRRPRLPGQDVPGLGLMNEFGTMLALIAARLGMGAVVFRPAHFHTAYAARHAFQFVDPARQGRFEALLRDLAGVPLLEATNAVAAGQVKLDGAPYAWEADEMAYWLREPPVEAGEVELERDRVRFTYERPPATGAAGAP
jgi:acetoin utilization deacetylase AcuC-like enzyme